jgi:hypothetical protein
MLAGIDDGGVPGAQAGEESGGNVGQNDGARAWMNGRSMWWYLDGDGFPIPGQGGINDGQSHMVFF